ncbi:hypothetical protein JCM5350_005700 [Sporobolomyces pararoseus]
MDHQQQYLSAEQGFDQRSGGDYSAPPPPRNSSSSSKSAATTSTGGRKRSADHLEDEDLYSQADQQLDRDVKDEDSSAVTSNSTTTGGGGVNSNNKSNAARKNRNAAPPLKRGNACMLCRKRKLRCDGIRPKCGTCARLSHDCVYGGKSGRPSPELNRLIRKYLRP